MLFIRHFWGFSLHPFRLWSLFHVWAVETISLGTRSGHMTPYHPQGNGQCEQYNGIIWKTIQLAAANHKCLISHASMYSHKCYASHFNPEAWRELCLTSQLSKPGTVLLRWFVCHNKNDPLTNRVELIEVKFSVCPGAPPRWERICFFPERPHTCRKCT